MLFLMIPHCSAASPLPSACFLYADPPNVVVCIVAILDPLCTVPPVVKQASARLRGCVCSQLGFLPCLDYGAW